MAFSIDMPIPEWALNDFKKLVQELATKYPVKPGLLTRIYLHWTVAPHGVEFQDYNLEVVLRDGKLSIDVVGNPQDNAPGLNSNPVHSHTWHRNTGAVGVSIDGMDYATIHNFGPDGFNGNELLYLCGAAAAVAKVYDIDISGKVPAPGSNHLDNKGNNVNTTGEPNVLTHGECAVIDSYPSERWDLGTLVPLPDNEELTPAIRTHSGDELRTMAHRIKLML